MAPTRKRKRFHPAKYYRGLTRRQKIKREGEIAHFGAFSTGDPRAYVGFKTDRGVKTRSSSYTQRWTRRFPRAKSLESKAAVTGVPLRLIKRCYDRGMAAWRTGHRPGATQQQWGYARVHSLLLCGKTAHTADADILREAKRGAGARWFKRCS